ncbi:hypothetical protein N658DRAFT_499512 [Parathielavia hyrcaniae]|uniref:Protein kinase domain-containing protein n=1 Tax=Parathielavia hyrcaniae TaxID=113614 RepID=A0AAN6SZ28_9PEZI|nr:hypothetical protein N658DRAFT_499512 [Parathielavia hyrcaniae]
MAPLQPAGQSPGLISNANRLILPLIRESFDLLVDAFADQNLRFYFGRIELQRTIFQTWDHPDPLIEQADGPADILAPPLSGEQASRGQRQQLILFLRTLSDPAKLKVKYGLRVERPEVLQRLDELSIDMKYVTEYLYDVDSRHFTWFQDLASFQVILDRHLKFLKTTRFVVSGGDVELTELILWLEDFNRHLLVHEPRQKRDVLRRDLFERVARDAAKDPDRTKRLEEAAAYEAKSSIDGMVKAQYDDLSKLANFSLAIHAANPAMSRRKIFTHADLSYDTPYYINKNSTLARLFDYPTKYQSRLVLVEWITLTIGQSGTTLESSDVAKVTWFILHAERPEKLLLPATIGLIIDESDPWRLGMVYQLPPHIRGNLPTKPATGGRVVRSSKTIAAERMPTTLRQLMVKQPKALALEVRIQIAKKLLDAVYLMHTARFTHRNIRPDNILFFPAANENNEPVPSTVDLANPLIFGFHDAPLEIQISTELPTPYAQPGGLKPILKNPNRKPPRDVVIDCYTHPHRRRDPRAPYRRHYDLYSVGCVLLELGLWETLDQASGRDIALRASNAAAAAAGDPLLVDRRAAAQVEREDIRKDAEVLEKAAARLDAVTGRIYAEVTRACLYVKESPLRDVLEYEKCLAAALAQVTV